MGRKGQVETWLEKLKLGTLNEQGEAVFALGESRDTRALEPLLEMLGQLRARLHLQDEFELVLVQQVMLALGSLGDQRAIPALVTMLEQGPRGELEVEETACIALSSIGGAEALNALKSKFSQPGCAIHQLIAEELVSTDGDASANFFLGQLRDGSAESVCASAWALGQLGCTAALLPLQRLLRLSDPEVREVVIEALRRLADKPTQMLLGIDSKSK
jgi:HEAT repeat protein